MVYAEEASEVAKEQISLQFQVNPRDAVIDLRDSENNRLLGTNNEFQLNKGDTYTYSIAKYGYLSQTSEITPDDNEVVTIELKNAPVSDLEEVSAEWSDFRNSSTNMGITDKLTPTDALSTELKWGVKLGSGWASAVGTPILVDHSLICTQGDKLVKYSLKDGTPVTDSEGNAIEGTMVSSAGFSIMPPTYAQGMIFVALSDGRIQAFNAKTLESLWVYQDPLKGQPNTSIKYSDGYIYTGFWNGEEKKGDYVCIPVTDEKPSETNEVKLATWKFDTIGGFYWAGAYIDGNHLIVGTDDGKSGYTSDTAKLYSIDKTTGNVIDVMDNFLGDIRSDVSYDEETNRVYFTSKGGYLYSVKINEDGTINKDSLQSFELGGMSTSTPVIYHGRAYVGVSGASQFGTDGHCVKVIEVANDGTMKEAYKVPAKGYPQTSALLSTAYEKSDGCVYVYIPYNAMPGGILCLKDKKGQTEADSYEIFTPEGAMKQYCICSVICDNQGTLYYKNDSGYMMAVYQKRSIESLSLNQKELKLHIGDTSELKVSVTPENTNEDTDVKWSSDHTEVATVESGVVKAVGNGSATITAEVSGKTVSCEVEVTTLCERVQLDKNGISLKENEKQQLTAAITPSTASNKKLKWTSSNESIAKVSDDGMVTAVTEGTAIIRVVTVDGSEKSAECSVTVTKEAAPILPSPSTTPSPSPDTVIQPQPQTTVTPLPTTIPSVSKQLPKKGKTVWVGSLKVKITKSAKKNGTVAVVSYNKKKSKGKSITIPDQVKINGIMFKVTKIEKKVFLNKKNLANVIIGKNVSNIGAQAFKGCSKLKKITIKSNNLTSVGKDALKGISKKAVIKVPSKKLKKYKALLKKKGISKTVVIKK
ncbi:hypothetical protein lbkm_0336 [Lachnospiraceae bacterium KM106-2]|nr:hypothetical protein lbkm_0336 [Lachnospiraceae bacterium KM106-2]